VDGIYNALREGEEVDGMIALQMAETTNMADFHFIEDDDDLYGFDGEQGWAIWETPSLAEASSSTFHILVHMASDDTRGLRIWLQATTEEDDESKVLVARKVATATTGSYGTDSLEWFHYGPFDFSVGDGLNCIKIQTPGYWPHVRQFVLVPTEQDAIPVAPFQEEEEEGSDDEEGSDEEEEWEFPEPKELLQIEHVTEMIEAAQERVAQQEEFYSRFLFHLRKPQDTTEGVNVAEDMINVDGCEESYTFEFENTNDDVEVFLDVTHTSGDPRPVIFTLNDDNELGRDFCSQETDGWDLENVQSKRHGPFVLPAGTNRLTVSTDLEGESGGYFPSIAEIRVVDVELADEDVSEFHYDDRVWIVPPSQPVDPEVEEGMSDFCRVSGTQEPNIDFEPDPDFYNAINADGLWICASKEVDERVLQRAAELVCRYIPVELRGLFLKWRSPHDSPVGPMRLVILDNITGQQAGDCPDFPDEWTGRNGTATPGCFTSAEDLHGHDSNGELTVHEMMHALDMVIRQQLDPYFNQELINCYNKAIEAGTYKKAYAASNPHEYVAELCTLFVNTHPLNFTYGCHACSPDNDDVCDFEPHQDMEEGPGGVDMTRKSDLIQNDPDAYELLKKYLIEIKDPDDDSPWWEE